MKVEVKIPAVGESVNSAIIGSWEKPDSSYVERDEVLALLETDKASVELPAPASGQLEIIKKEGGEIPVGEVIARIDTSYKKPALSKNTGGAKQPQPSAEPPPEKQEEKTAPAEQPAPKETPSKEFDPSRFSPAVRHSLLEENIDPALIQGTGKQNRMTKADILSFKEQKTFTQSPALNKNLSQEPEEIKREKMTTIRKRIAEKLVASQHETATLTTFNEVDMSRIIQLRKEYKEIFQKKYGVKLGFMGFFIKAVIQALKVYPRAGGRIEGDELVYSSHCHISIAVSTAKGLLVPVIKYADKKSIVEIEEAVSYFAEKARDGKILPDDLSGGIFTISNGGVFGSLLSTPILNPPQSGILGMHKIEQRAVVQGGQIIIRPMMYLALSYDHRIVDGKESVGFLVKVKECIEEPARVLLDL